ncbi:MAG: FecR domain-containing protein [Gammaproteobacteria bacterium]|nr:FecR domain-containing protein [Gammaproteobacteria bacterium]
MNIIPKVLHILNLHPASLKKVCLNLALIFSLLSPSISTADEWTYTTRPNDTIWDISKKYLKSVNYWKKLQAHNSVDIAKRLSPGTKLRIPVEWLKIQAAAALVLSVTGKVNLQTFNNKTLQALNTKQLINIGDTIITGDNGSALIQFADNSSLLVQKNSQVVFNTLSVYGQSGMVDTQVRLQQGRVETAVKPLKDSISRFEITTPAAVAAVRGTAFRVAYEETQETMASEVVKGSINLAAQGSKLPINKGFGSITEKGNPPQAPVKLLDKPTLSKLPEKIRHLPFSFKWSPLDGAINYRIQISPAEQSNSLVLEGTQATNQYNLKELNDGEYLMRVRGIDKNRLEGFNAEHKFTLNTNFPVVTLIQPADKSEISTENIDLKWSKEEEVSQYRVQVSTNIDFSKTILDELIKDNSISITEELTENTYFWRVIAVDELGNTGKPSEINKFEVSGNPYEALLILLYLLPAFLI